MKRWIIRILSVGLTLMLCTGATAESMDDITYTMSEKLMKQLEAGSGFVGTLTLTSTAVQGRETEAFTTGEPIAMDLTYIKAPGDPGETRVKLTMDSSGYQQGSAELSIQDGTMYLLSSLTGDNWLQLGTGALSGLLRNADTPGMLPDVTDISQIRGVLPASLSFFSGMAWYLIGGNLEGLSDVMEQYTTKIDFWLEGYRESVQMDTIGDGASVMNIEYRIPPAAVKAQLKQFLVDLMSDEELLSALAALMPESQAERFLAPSLQPYYFYAVNELPLAEDLVIKRVVSFIGETVELSVIMPLYDNQNGAMTLQYTRQQKGEDMPDENILRLTGKTNRAELSYHSYETITGTSVYQGTAMLESTPENGEAPKTLLASFDISSSSVTTKDLNGYETQNQNWKLSVAQGETEDTQDTKQYIEFPAMDISLEMRAASLTAKNAPTDVNISATLSGVDMAQEITLEITGTTTSRWTPTAFTQEEAMVLTDMPQEDQDSLLSQAAIKGGLLFLPYINLPQPQTEAAE